MDIKLCGTQDEEPWTEAVLFKDGQEMCCSEPGVMHDGPWTLECDGNTYTAMVVMEKPDKEKGEKGYYSGGSDIPMDGAYLWDMVCAGEECFYQGQLRV